jgi:exosortase/archaeosortase family protein
VPTDITRTSFHVARNFALRAVAWSLGLFGLLRLAWMEGHVLLPATRAQAAVAAGWFGASSMPVDVTLACSGADASALCMAAVLAYPATWRMRLAGSGAGLALILVLNIMRIGTLGRVATSPAWFDALHLYVWPAVLTLAIAGYVFGWMRFVDRPSSTDGPAEAGPYSYPASRLQPPRRFVVLSFAFLIPFLLASPLYLESRAVLALAGAIAGAAAALLGGVGVGARAVANVLSTSQGSFTVTQECISTPLIPIYLAAVCTYSRTWGGMIFGVLAAPPLFVALGIARLLVVALPAAVVVSPIFVVHAFYQLLLGAVLVFLAARWRHRGKEALGYALAGVCAGVIGSLLLVQLLGPICTRVIASYGGAPLEDPQGAIGQLPAFQDGLYLALCVAAFVAVGWKRFAAGFAVLGLTQAAGVFALHALAAHAQLVPHVRDIRGWAVAAPVLIFAAVVSGARPRR